MLYVLSQTVGQSRSAGLASAVGLCLGGVLLAIATALGLAGVFAKFEWIVTGMRYVGAAYLIWLGIGMIQSARQSARLDLTAQGVYQRSIRSILWQGVLVELLNPKTVLFFALFLPPFVMLENGQASGFEVTLQLLVLGAIVPLTALPSDILVAFLGGKMAKTLNRSRKARVALSTVGGLALIGIAVSLLWQSLS
jgi:threonine/homoserine/homoserine lactone efflux protein